MSRSELEGALLTANARAYSSTKRCISGASRTQCTPLTLAHCLLLLLSLCIQQYLLSELETARTELATAIAGRAAAEADLAACEEELKESVASDECNDATISEQAAKISKLKQANTAAATRAFDCFVTARQRRTLARCFGSWR
eukprot:11116-Heterococcus_DN1.PRE.1